MIIAHWKIVVVAGLILLILCAAFAAQSRTVEEGTYDVYFGRVVSAELVPWRGPKYVLYTVVLGNSPTKIHKSRVFVCSTVKLGVDEPVMFRVSREQWTAQCGTGGYRIPFESLRAYVARGYEIEDLRQTYYRIPSALSSALRCDLSRQVSVLPDARIPGKATRDKRMNHFGAIGGIAGTYILDSDLRVCLPKP